MTGPEFKTEYAALANAIQSGVAFDQSTGSEDGTPKHLRVGLNLRARDHSGLVELLVAKGVITYEEYFDVVIGELEAELADYKELIERKTGRKVDLA